MTEQTGICFLRRKKTKKKKNKTVIISDNRPIMSNIQQFTISLPGKSQKTLTLIGPPAQSALRPGGPVKRQTVKIPFPDNPLSINSGSNPVKPVKFMNAGNRAWIHVIYGIQAGLIDDR